MWSKILSIFLLLTIVSAKLVSNTTEYEIIPMPLQGWLETKSLYGMKMANMSESFTATVKDKIGLYIFDPTKYEFEEFVRNVQNTYNPAVILFPSVQYGGRDFLITNGKSDTKDLYTPTFGMKVSEFKKLAAISSSETYNIIYDMKNPYYEEFNKPHWNIMLSFPTILSLIGSIFGLYVIYLFIKDALNKDKDFKFGNAHIAVLLETLGNIIRFFDSLDLVDSRRLFNYKFTRIVLSLHIVCSLNTAFLIILYSGYLIKMDKNGRKAKAFMDSKVLKIILICIIVTTFSMEIGSIIARFSSAKYMNLWNAIVIFTYTGLGLLITCLVIAVSVTIVRIMKFKLFDSTYADNTVANKTKQLIKGFTYRTAFTSICYIIFTVSIFISAYTNFLLYIDYTDFLLMAAYPHIFIILSLTTASIIHIYSYMPQSGKIYISSTSTTNHKSTELNTSSNTQDI